jgi:hypothetical protein
MPCSAQTYGDQARKDCKLQLFSPGKPKTGKMTITTIDNNTYDDDN